jgi:DNA-binding GntR family transcriptional regulator
MRVSIKGTADQIADALRAEIESGEMEPGTPLNQIELAARFGLSRIPVREALRHLEAEGYLTYRPNKGATVAASPALAELLEIIEIRECLELRIMRRALPNMSPDVIARATEAMNAMNRARDESAVRGAHERFHSLLFAAAVRPKMTGFVNDWRLRYCLADQRAFLRSTRAVHRRLLEGCAVAKVRAVESCVREEYDLIRQTVSTGGR